MEREREREGVTGRTRGRQRDAQTSLSLFSLCGAGRGLVSQRKAAAMNGLSELKNREEMRSEEQGRRTSERKKEIINLTAQY